jgi:LPS export ABC transporter protein LptC
VRNVFEITLTPLPAIMMALVLTALVSCENKIPTISKSDILRLPSATSRNHETVYTDSGKIQVVMTAPLIEKYDNADPPYFEFRSGLMIFFHDGNREPVARVSAKYAKYIESKTLWELKDSVVVINETHDKLETELLFFDEKKELIYTDRFVKITNDDQIVMGTGFESDPRLERRKIRNVSATIYLTNDQ